jgi:hypothetical protein
MHALFHRGIPGFVFASVSGRAFGVDLSRPQGYGYALRQFVEGKAAKIEDTLRRIVREEIRAAS